jgi:hypothetical protein
LPGGQTISIQNLIDDWLCPTCIDEIFPFVHIVDDNLYFKLIADLQTQCYDLSFEKLNSLVFNPFEINDTNEIFPLTDIDPDLNYFNNLEGFSTHCSYYLSDKFNNECQKLCINQDSLSLLHQNIRSLPKNYLKFDTFLSTLSIEFNIIGLSETWLNQTNEAYYDVPGYTSILKNRDKRKGGGVALLIKEHIRFTQRDDLTRSSDHIECLFVEIDKSIFKTEKDIIVGILYRPPDTDINKFIESLEELFSDIDLGKYTCYLLGDYNINLLNVDNHTSTASFIDLLFENGLMPAITKPTRVTDKSATLIDNIVHNSISNNNHLKGILYSDITDHYPVFLIDFSKSSTPRKKYFVVRDYSDKNKNAFKQKLQNTNWEFVLTSNNPAESFDEFHQTFLNMYNDSFPEKTIKSGYHTRKPWLTSEMKIKIKRKNILYIKSRKNPSPERISYYKCFRNNLNSEIRKAEREYYKNYIDMNKYNLKKTWRLLKNIINKRKDNTLHDTFVINGKQTNDSKKIANSFNKYFVNVGSTLSKQIPITNETHFKYLPNKTLSSIYLRPVTKKEIIKLIKNLKSSSPGWDNITADVVKESYELFIEPLLHVINLSLKHGYFPDNMKLAKVLPLFKSGDKMMFSNYRPISILPIFSKLFERVMYNKILNFIEKQRLFYINQFGFRNNHTTALALTALLDKITESMNNNEYMVGVFLDFSKAFDTVDHSILLQKLYHYGIRGPAYQWISNYLTNRYQFVCFNSVCSDRERITCGVPQGSILGPLLFLLYINDISHVSTKLFSILFADDSNIFFSGKNIHEVINTMNCELNNIVKWINTNKLSLNIKKSNYMVFNKSKVKTYTNIVLNGIDLNRIYDTKFLGVYIDAELTWKQHVNYTKNKIAKGIGLLIKARKTLSYKCLINLYYSFIYPYLTYCIEIWGGTYNSYLNTIFLQQKRIIRIIANAKRDAKSKPLFDKLQILTLSKIYVYRILLFLYKFENNLLPETFQSLFTRRRDIHSYETRQRNNLNIPNIGSQVIKNSFFYNAVMIYNTYAPKFNFSSKPNTFKSDVREFLLKNDI